MKIKQGVPFVIMSSLDINQLASDLLRRGFKNWKYVKGCYHGNIERSILITLSGEPMKQACDMIDLETVSMWHKQESILYVDHNRDATLIKCGRNASVSLGKFVRIRSFETEDLQNWTQDLKTGQYWSTKLAA